jgi:ribosomal protein S12 methylthiotransferase accessory factor
MHTLSNSIRSRDLRDTLPRAEAAARNIGIARVAEITHLDRIGLPVFVSIRPLSNYLCVSAGKGFTPMEAKVGALMEGYEMAVAEIHRPEETLNDRLGVMLRAYGFAFLDFSPVLGASYDPDLRLSWVSTEDLLSEELCHVPASMVVTPPAAEYGPAVYGSTTNGLSSGNSVAEATCHALCEVIERDIQSFQRARDTSRLVDPNSLPGPVLDAVNHISEAGFNLWLRSAHNVFELPFFSAVIADPADRDPARINAGYGCHPSPCIAASRAVCEAVQSRLGFIHGARDDLAQIELPFKRMSPVDRAIVADELQQREQSTRQTIRFEDVSGNHSAKSGTPMDSLVSHLLEALSKAGLKRALRYIFPVAEDLAVVRVIVPGAENFSSRTKKVGRRLAEYVREGAQSQ